MVSSRSWFRLGKVQLVWDYFILENRIALRFRLGSLEKNLGLYVWVVFCAVLNSLEPVHKTSDLDFALVFRVSEDRSRDLFHELLLIDVFYQVLRLCLSRLDWYK